MAKIVIVDDEIVVCETIKYWFQAKGHDVRTAITGEEAIDYGYLFKPDVLIADWSLKCDYDGIEVAEAFKVANKQTKIILMTGRSITEARKRAAETDILATIAKPFALSELSRTVEEVIAYRKVLTHAG